MVGGWILNAVADTHPQPLSCNNALDKDNRGLGKMKPGTVQAVSIMD